MKIRVAFQRYGRKQLPDIYGPPLAEYIAGVPKKQIAFKQLSGPQVRNPLGVFLTLYEGIKKKGFAKGIFAKGVVEKGHLLVRGGYHRLSIAHALGKPSSIVLNVKVTPRFEKFYRHMLAMQGKGTTHMYAPIDHWSVSNWSFERGTNRPGLVLRELDSPKCTFLDLGCNVGQVAHALAARGHSVTGVDRSDRAVYCAKFLADYYASMPGMLKKWPLELGHVTEWVSRYAGYKKPRFVHSELDAFLQKRKRKVDYALFLSVHRWLRKDPHCNVYAFLRKLDTLVKCGIFVDGRDIEATLRAVTGYTRFKYAKLLGTEKGGSGKYQRPMYLCLEEKP